MINRRTRGWRRLQSGELTGRGGDLKGTVTPVTGGVLHIVSWKGFDIMKPSGTFPVTKTTHEGTFDEDASETREMNPQLSICWKQPRHGTPCDLCVYVGHCAQHKMYITDLWKHFNYEYALSHVKKWREYKKRKTNENKAKEQRGVHMELILLSIHNFKTQKTHIFLLFAVKWTRSLSSVLSWIEPSLPRREEAPPVLLFNPENRGANGF